MNTGNRQGVSAAFSGRYTPDIYPIVINGIDTPGLAGTYTYNLQAWEETGATIYLNKQNNDADVVYTPRLISTITLIEIEE